MPSRFSFRIRRTFHESLHDNALENPTCRDTQKKPMHPQRSTPAFVMRLYVQLLSCDSTDLFNSNCETIWKPAIERFSLTAAEDDQIIKIVQKNLFVYENKTLQG